jgi:rhodanese-related sulfurtransferase
MKKVFTMTAFFALAACVIASCSHEHGENSAPPVSEYIQPEAAYELIKSKKNDENFIILDVRTSREFNSGRIENAVLLDFYEPEFGEKLNSLDRNKTYFVYSRTANRSSTVLIIMRAMRFMEVYVLAGGMSGWRALGYPVIQNGKNPDET